MFKASSVFKYYSKVLASKTDNIVWILEGKRKNKDLSQNIQIEKKKKKKSNKMKINT